MRSYKRAVIICGGVAMWAVAAGLTVALVYEFTAGQQTVIVGVAMLAIAVSSIGLLKARHAWQQRAWLSAVLGVLLWAGGVAFLTLNELGYWASSFDARHREYQESQAALKKKAAMKDEAWRALTTGGVPESPEQVEALMKSALAKPIGNMTLGEATQKCTDEKAWSFRYCQNYLGLKARYAAAQKREELEKAVSSSSAQELGTVHVKVKQNVYAHAELLARKFGGSVENWADFIVLTSMIFLMLARDVSLFIAFAPERGHETPVEPRGGGGKFPPLKAPEEQPAPVADVPAQPEREKPKLIVDNTIPKPAPRPRKPRAKAKKAMPKPDPSASVSEWIKSATVAVSEKNAMPSKETRLAYEAWCVKKGIIPLESSRFGRAMKKHGAKTGKRNAAGATYCIRLREGEAVKIA